jgi:hypothetical protein
MGRLEEALELHRIVGVWLISHVSDHTIFRCVAGDSHSRRHVRYSSSEISMPQTPHFCGFGHVAFFSDLECFKMVFSLEVENPHAQ